MSAPWLARTRGGMFVALVVVGAIGWEIRTVLGMFFGIDLPATPYLIVMIGLLSVFGVIVDVYRSANSNAVGR